MRQPAKNHPCKRSAIAEARWPARESRALPRRDRAFTLIELLVVIAIVAILIGLFLPTLFGFYERAKKVQAKNDLTQIVNAVNAFYTEYGKYPVAVNDNTFADNSGVMYTLRADPTTANGNPNANNVVNTRQIVFISPRVLGTAPVRSGVASSNGQYYDPWARQYQLAINGTYDNSLPNPYGNNTGAGPDPLQQGVIAWSLGRDGCLGTKQSDNSCNGVFTNSDDVISWQ